MTPIPLPLPAGRILPPTVAYAAGLVCEHRPDIADVVRSAVLGDSAMTALDVLTLARVEADDEQGYQALAYLREIVHYGGNDPKALHGLADVLGLIPAHDLSMSVWTPDSKKRIGTPTIGDVYCVRLPHYFTVGMGGAFNSHVAAMNHSGVLVKVLTYGFGVAWERLRVDGAREALRHLVPIHAHTVSLDPAIRAAWATAHLDALTPPVRPQSPDRLT